MSKSDQISTVINLRPRPDFVNTKFVDNLTDRALAYIRAGYAVHLRGPAGTGKTTMALHIASLIGRPVVLLFGDDEFGSSDLVGSQSGYSYKRIIDNYIHSVRRTEEDMQQQWIDNRLTVACEEGFTLVYDEFTRSRPEANNVLLSILEEKLMAMPAARKGSGYIRVHPKFSAIFTSNPEEYAGVHKTQDALLDRMIAIEVERLDADTEISITEARAGITLEEATRIVNVVRDFRELSRATITPTVRSCCMIGKVVAVQAAQVWAADESFRQTCRDVLLARLGHGRIDAIELSRAGTLLDDLINQYCATPIAPMGQCDHVCETIQSVN